MVRYLFYTIGDLTYPSPLVHLLTPGTLWATPGLLRDSLLRNVGVFVFSMCMNLKCMSIEREVCWRCSSNISNFVGDVK